MRFLEIALVIALGQRPSSTLQGRMLVSRSDLARRLRLLALSILLLLGLSALTGCSRKGDIYGKVTCQGKPVVYGTVSIVGADGIPRTGNIHPDGYYEVFDVPVGSAKIGVASPDPEVQHQSLVAAQRNADAANRIVPPSVDKAQWFAISPIYIDPEGSGLVHVVQRGNNEHDIVLEQVAEPPPKSPKDKDQEKKEKDKPPVKATFRK